jgi:hypothetical protein
VFSCRIMEKMKQSFAILCLKKWKTYYIFAKLHFIFEKSNLVSAKVCFILAKKLIHLRPCDLHRR